MLKSGLPCGSSIGMAQNVQEMPWASQQLFSHNRFWENQSFVRLLFLCWFGLFTPWCLCICDRFDSRQCCDSHAGIFKVAFSPFHLSNNIVYSEICHKYIHIMGWKDQIRKEIATCQNFGSPRICCEKAAAGILRVLPVHFVPLQSNSTHCNVHGSHTAT